MARRVRRVRRTRRASRASTPEVGQVDAALGPADAAASLDDDGVGGVSGVKKKGDGFEAPHQEGRGAYDAYLKNQVEGDAARFDQLRQGGQLDTFDPAAEPGTIEKQGQLQAATHMVRLYDHWTLSGIDRAGAIEKAAQWLTGFSRADNVRKVITELESRPIRDVYPLEVMLKILETAPEKLPGMKLASVFAEAPAIKEERVFAGHPIQLPVPKDVRLKAFALLGGHRPGYELNPSATRDDAYTLLIDTPGRWELALFGVRTQDLGKITKELPGGFIERLVLEVREMGRKESPDVP